MAFSLTDALGWRELEPEWAELLSGSAADTFFLSWSWLWQWWEHWGSGLTLNVIVIRDRDGRLVAGAPLCIRPLSAWGVSWGRELGFIASGQVKSDYLDMIVRREGETRWRQILLEAVLASSKWDVLRLEGIPEGSPTLEALAAELQRAEMPYRIEVEEAAPYLPLPGNGNGTSDVIGSKLRSAIRRQRRALERLGKVEFEVVGDPKALSEALDSFAELNQSRLAAKGIQGGFRVERFAAFQRGVAADLFERGELRLCFLRLDGRPIAGLLIFAYGGKYLYYQSGLDGEPTWARFSPGTIILGAAIDYATLEGMTEFDFLRGEEAYKSRFTDRSRRLMRVTAYRPTGPGLLCRAMDGTTRALHCLREMGRRGGQ